MIGSQGKNDSRGIVFYWLYKNGVVISPSTRVRAIEGKTVLAFNAHTGEERRIDNVDSVVVSLGSRPADERHPGWRGVGRSIVLRARPPPQHGHGQAGVIGEVFDGVLLADFWGATQPHRRSA